MENVLLFIVILPLFIVGYKLMGNVDKFLIKNENKGEEAFHLHETESSRKRRLQFVEEVKTEIEEFCHKSVDYPRTERL